MRSTRHAGSTALRAQLAGGQAHLRSELYEKVPRDIRIFPIFEGANDGHAPPLRGTGRRGRRRALIAETFCVRAADRVRRQFEQIEHNDDDRAFAIATSASERTRYHHTV